MSSRPDCIAWAFCAVLFLIALLQNVLGMRLVAFLKDVVEENARLLEENERLRGRSGSEVDDEDSD
jgi:regulator of replication initiation timing